MLENSKINREIKPTKIETSFKAKELTNNSGVLPPDKILR
jgi:hypothetical protein